MDAFLYRKDGNVLSFVGPRLLSLEVGERHGISSHSTVVNPRTNVTLTRMVFNSSENADGAIDLVRRIGLIKGPPRITDEDLASFNDVSETQSIVPHFEKVSPGEVVHSYETHLCTDCKRPLVKKQGRGRWPTRCETCKQTKAK